MSEPKVLVDINEGIAIVKLNNPSRLNAISRAMGEEFDEKMVALGNDEKVKIIILTGNGRGFCAGADMKDAAENIDKPTITQPPPGWPHPVFDKLSRAPLELRNRYLLPAAVPQPVIAAVNGPCAGIGVGLISVCDIRFGSTLSSFACSFAKRGLVAEFGLSWKLPQIIGQSLTADMLMSGRVIDANEALRAGLISQLFEPENLMESTIKYAQDMVKNVSPRSLWALKRQFYAAQNQHYVDHLRHSAIEVRGSLESEDRIEGVTSFAEGRAPNFSGKI